MATQQALSWGYFDPSPVPDVATGQTVSFMCKLVDRSAKSPVVQACAQDAVQSFGPLGAYNPTATIAQPGDTGSSGYKARAVYWWVRYHVGRLHHDEFKATVQAFPEKKQLLIAPDALLVEAQPAGDCSAFTMAVCALLKCLGVPYEMVAVATNANDPAIFTHVYPRAVLEGGARLPLDAHAGDWPGWEAPKQDVFKKQAYDSQGTPVPDKQTSGFKGLHQYTARGLGQEDCVQYDEYGDCLEYEPSTSLSSLIDVTGYNPADWGQDLSNFFDFTPSSGVTASSCAPPLLPDPIFGGCYSPLGSNANVGGVDTSLSNFFDFTPSSGLTVSGAVDASGAPLAGTFLSSSPTQPITIVPSSWGTSSANPLEQELFSLANAWTKIGGQVVAPQTTITSGGQTITTPYNPASAIPGLNMSSSSLMTIAVLGVVALIAFKALSGGK